MLGRLALALAILFLCLSACGGGGSDPPAASGLPPLISLYGDSLMVGAYGLDSTIKTPPTESLSKLLGGRYRVELRGVSGASALQAVAGDPPRWPWAPFADQVRIDAPKIVVLRFGGADAIYATDPEKERVAILRMAREAKAAGAQVLVMGVIPLVASPAYVARAAQMDQINRNIAATEDSPFVDVRSLGFDPARDLAPGDPVHPNQAYSDRMMELLARSVP